MRDIFEYIAHDNPEAAARVVEGVYDRVQVLAEFPRIGHRHEPVPDREVRTLLYGTIVLRTGSSRTTISTFWMFSTALSISSVT